jgi:hypothetical protein
VVKPAGPAKVAPKFWWIPGAVGVLAAVPTAILLTNAAGKYEELLNKPATSSTQGRTWATEGQSMQTAGWLIGGVGVAAITASILWLALGSTDVQPQVSLGPAGASLGLRGQF